MVLLHLLRRVGAAVINTTDRAGKSDRPCGALALLFAGPVSGRESAEGHTKSSGRHQRSAAQKNPSCADFNLENGC